MCSCFNSVVLSFVLLVLDSWLFTFVLFTFVSLRVWLLRC